MAKRISRPASRPSAAPTSPRGRSAAPAKGARAKAAAPAARGKGRSAARGRGASPSSPAARAREVAGAELVALFGGGIDPDDHLFRSLDRGPRDLPLYTHERQIELAFGLYLTDPIAKRILDIRRDYTVADGLRFEIAESEAEKAAAQEEAAALARRKPKATPSAPPVVPGKPPPNPAIPPSPTSREESGGPPGIEESGRASEADPLPFEAETDDDQDEDLDDEIEGDLARTTDPAPGSDDEPTVEEIRAVLEAHWKDPDNAWDLKQGQRALALGLWGEQIWPVFVRPTDGHVKLGALDPRWVQEVRADPENAERIDSVILKNTADGGPGRSYRAIRVMETAADVEAYRAAAQTAAARPVAGPVTPGARPPLGPTMPAAKSALDHPEPRIGFMAGDVFYFAVNGVQGARRGHSDLFHLIDWIDGYGSLLFDAKDAARMQRAYIFDVTLKGAKPDEIAQFLKKNKTPRPGSIRAHNEKVTWQAVSPELKATEHVEFAGLYKRQILGGAGFPEHWFAEGDSAVRATAKEMAAPVLMSLKERRRFFCHMVEQALRYQVDQAILAGKLRGTAKTKERVRVTAAEFETRDVVAASSALAQVTSALATATGEKWITPATARRTFASVADHLGVKIDADAEGAALDGDGAEEAEAERDAAKAEAEGLRAALAGAVAGNGTVPPQKAGEDGQEDEGLEEEGEPERVGEADVKAPLSATPAKQKAYVRLGAQVELPLLGGD